MRKRIDPIMAIVVNACGAFVLFMVAALLFYLGRESQYAFKQVFPYGYRFAVTSPERSASFSLEADPYASVLTANIEGANGIDDKEETMPMPSVDQLVSDDEVAPVGGTGVFIPIDAKYMEDPASAPPNNTLNLNAVDPMFLFRDEWRAAKPAETGDTFHLFAFATPELKGQEMVLVWGPDASFLPELAPYRIQLKLLRVPEGIAYDGPREWDLRQTPSGRIVLPAFIAPTDEARTQGYVFQMVATPTTSTFAATVRNAFRTDWAPTLNYARYGIVPLILSTLIITILAVLLSAPVSIGLALYMSEIAPARIKEWLKPTVELLASIPTVVLAFFGLMTVAPAIKQWIGPAIAMDSTRSMVTCALMMAILLIPTIATVAEDALANLPRHLRDGADALGLTTRESIRKVLLPAAKSGLIGAVLLGMARAFGETMLVWLLSGGTVRMPNLASPQAAVQNLGQPTKGIPDTIGIEMGNVTLESTHYGHLFLIGLILFLITLVINLTGYRLARRNAWTQ